MPELPEVESTRRELSKLLKNDFVIDQVIFSSKELRFPTPKLKFKKSLPLKIEGVFRRAKYLWWKTDKGLILSHLGMSGSWRQEVQKKYQPRLHDHVVLKFQSGSLWVYNDPRRFGMFDWFQGQDLQDHPLISHLGPEPLSPEFSSEYLFAITRNKKVSIKSFIMNQENVVGVGNIYALEALFLAKIKPSRKSHSLSRIECQALVESIQSILERAIQAGGSTIQSFEMNHKAGSYQENHLVYGRHGKDCVVCRQSVKHRYDSGRSSYWCAQCQK